MAASPTSVLLGSGGIATEERRETYRDLVSQHFRACNQVLFVSYASHDHSSYTSKMQDFLGVKGPALVGIESMDDSVSAIEEAEGIYVGGGNSFLLVRALHEKGLVKPIRDAVVGRGLPYLGVSAGANVASPTIMTTNDMPICLPPSFDSFGIVPFQINPHYHPGKINFLDGGDIVKHYGESRAQRIAEYHRTNDTPVLGMWEGSFVQWDGSKGKLFGRATSFRRGEEPSEIENHSEFTGDLVPVD